MTSADALDPDRTLALAYVPAARRPAVEALWRLDLALGAVLRAGREPLITQIKLAWWRQALERLDVAPPPAEPVLEALARHVLPQGISGASLAQMEPGWEILLTADELRAEEMRLYAAQRGGLLFRYSALLLGSHTGYEVERGGEAWALVDLARRSGDRGERKAALALASEVGRPAGRWPVPLRPLGMLGMLALRDAQRQVGEPEPMGSPGRMWRMIRHRMTGR